MSFYDAEGERLSTVRLARMPEKHKATLKDTLSEEIAAVLEQRPDLTLVKLADGAKDNWTYLGAVLPQGIEIIDFYHACEHLKAAFDAPLAIAAGAGANARHSVGTGIIGGMVGATTLALFFVPLFYYLIGRLSAKLSGQAAEAKPADGGGRALHASPAAPRTDAH